MDSPKEFNCVFCKETFESKEELQIHFRKHGDPKFNQSTKSKVRPNDTPGEKCKEEAEMISCDVCTELFPTISKAITHKHKVHPDHDAKYFCPWCGKLFTMKHLYNKHISTNHENSTQSDDEDFPCDCCDVTFNLSSAMLYHNKFFHRQDTDLPAIGHSKRLKLINQCSMFIYYCPFCGQEYNNKVNLHKHMGDDHCDENQSPDDVLRCPLCDAIFYHLDAYEHHLSFHSVDDMYTENNEMFGIVTEFSLESVPPIMERVENLEPEPEPEPKETGHKTMNLDDFLQISMGHTVDEDNPRKSKKHKKHKKSKKAAITLDEFLNMNKDVFGEGIDVQGIEEVPSQVVAKTFKVKKKAALHNSGSKMSPKEIDKLRKQGIIIKMKGTPMKKQIQSKIKQIPVKATNMNPQQESTDVKTSSAVLSKLINISNNQLKIVRKPATNTDETNSIDDKKPPSLENLEAESDLILSSEVTGEENLDTSLNNNLDQDVKGSDSTKPLDNSDSVQAVEDTPKTDPTFQNDDDDEIEDDNIDLNKIVNDNSPTTFKNLNQHVSVKPVISSVRHITKTSTHNMLSDESNEKQLKLKQKEHNELKVNSNVKESNDKPINALKHLSHHITIKSVTQTNSTKLPSPQNYRDSSEDESNLDDSQINSDEDDGIYNSTMQNQNTQPAKTITPEPKSASLKSLNAFKNISSNVTIKPTVKNVQSLENQMSHSSDDEYIDSTGKNTAIQQSSGRPMAIKNIVKSPALSPKVNPSSIRLPFKEASVEDNPKSKLNANLLRNLVNVTAKPISNSNKVQTNKSGTPMNQTIKTQNKEVINQEIEIFNIDDSDSDYEENPPPKEAIAKPKVSEITNNTNIQRIDAFNLNKNITIKSTNKNNTLLNIKPDPDQDEFTDFPPDEDFETEPECHEENSKIINKTNAILKNTLKNLSKHITIKSRNSSPSSVVATREQDHENSNQRFNMNNDDSDHDSNPGQVKITEVDDEHELTEKPDGFDEDFNDNSIVQSPHDSVSNNDDDSQKTDEDFDDFESKIHANTVKRAESKHDENIKKIGKGITIKSLNENKTQSHLDSAAMTNSLASLPSNLSKEISIRPFKQGNTFPPDNVSQHTNKTIPRALNKVNKWTGQQIARSTVQPTNQKMCASTNQTNSVNKEVTVKTFQTKTVIQEITTTVTKTIKTVNQTTKQELQTTNQSCTQNMLRKVQGMRPQTQQPGKSYQGVVVRHATPVMGAKVRNPTTPIRPIRPSVKVSNQLVPVRPGVSLNVRPHTPRMPTIRGKTPSASTSTTKPVKMSPNIANSAMKKRAVAPESSRPFSCFKKSKESLIPVSEIPYDFNNREEDSMISFASSSQMNRSNIMNMTKTMKGNTVISSTQMKSEVSSCSQQLSKLNNMTGLRIVKTSQAKQASQVEEKQEINPAKRIALEAIEKLQKQGLLVKKPRFDPNDEGDFSDEEDGGDHFPPDDDDDFDAE